MGGKSSKPKIEVTEYRMSEHFGICSGPVDFISEIVINEKTAWNGKRAESGEILINKPSLFGGVKKEGGAVGAAMLLTGDATQVLPERLAAKIGLAAATAPGYRGLTSLWFTENDGASPSGFYWTANTPYLPGVWVKVARGSPQLNAQHARIWRGINEDAAIYFAIDTSTSMNELTSNGQSRLANMKSALVAMLQGMKDDGALGLDIHMVSFSGTLKTSIERRTIASGGYDDLISWVNGLTALIANGTDYDVGVSQAATFFAGSGSKQRALAFITDGLPEPTSSAADAVATLAGITSLSVYAFNIDLTDTTYTAMLDNTPDDGVPVVSGGDPSALQDALHVAFGLEFDSNPAHIIYESLTNSDWGMGAPASAIDVTGFAAAASVLFGERFGLSLIWTQQSTIEAFISEIIDHIEATLFVSPRTGLLTLKLIRDDYAITGLPEFTPDNSVVTNFTRKLWGETVNEIVVTFTNPENEQEETVVAQDLANISLQGGIVSDGRNYYGVRTRDLAMKLAQRDLRAASTPLASCDIEVNREAWDLLPGDVVILNSPDDGVEQLVMRVGPVDYGKPGDSTVRAQLVEDVFSLALADYTIPPATEAGDDSEPPTPADNTLIFTLPYYVAAQEASDLIGSAAYPEVLAGVLASEVGNDTADFELYGEVVDAAGNVSVDTLGTKTITSRGALEVDIAAEVETLFISFPDRTQGNGPTVGGLMLIEGTGESDSELCLISAFGGSPTAYTMKRGVLDTVPRDWPAGTPVWFVDTSMVFADPEIRSEGETVDYQILINTSQGQLDLDDAPIVSETLTARPWLPLRPANVKVNGDNGFAGSVDVIGVNPIPVTFARRNRLTEDSIILAWDAADVTPEVGQTTTVTLTDLFGVTIHTYAGITGTSHDVDPLNFNGELEGYIVVTSERDALESLQGYRIHVIVDTPPDPPAILLLSSIDELDPPSALLLSGDQTDGDDGLLLSGDQS